MPETLVEQLKKQVNEFGGSLNLDVMWYPDGDLDQTPHPAKIVGLGNTSVCLAIFEPDNHNLILRDGVKHVDDKTIRPNERIDQGLWEHTQFHKEFLGMRKRIEKLEKLLEKGK